MTNTNLLKSVMIAVGDDHYTDKLAEILGISKATANAKLNGKIQFTQSEIIKIAVHYNMNNNTLCGIFMVREGVA